MNDLRDKAQDLFRANLRTDKDWSPYRQMVANVFTAYFTRALSLDSVEGVARAIEGLPLDAGLEDAVRFFVRRKVLRSRQANGRRVYEVNFNQ